MSNTPRTDAAMVRMERLDGDIDEVVSADFAKRLEGHLAAAETQLIAARKTINQIKLEWEPPPSATERSLQVSEQAHARANAEVMRLAERLRKCEGGAPMHLNSEPVAARSATGATSDIVGRILDNVRQLRNGSDEHVARLLDQIAIDVGLLAAPQAAQVEETAIGHARYEYVRTLNLRDFTALYNEALGVHQFDDLVDRHRMKREQP